MQHVFKLYDLHFEKLRSDEAVREHSQLEKGCLFVKINEVAWSCARAVIGDLRLHFASFRRIFHHFGAIPNDFERKNSSKKVELQW